MIFIIFTADGLQQAKTDILAEQADLWLNPDLYASDLITEFNAADLKLFELPEQIDASQEKAVLAALTYVEKQAPDQEIMIECL